MRLSVQEEDEDVTLMPPADLPPNHKSGRGFASSDRNTLLGKESRFATLPPQEYKKQYEMMMAKLPVRDYPGYNVTGRDKPLNIVFVFPQMVNETRKKDLEVVLVFPHDKNATAATAPSTDPPTSTPTSGDVAEISSATTTEAARVSSSAAVAEATTEASTTTSVADTAAPFDEVKGQEDDDERLQQASERKEIRASAASALPSPAQDASTPAPSPIGRRNRQDIYKKYAKKYANSRLPPISVFQKSDATPGRYACFDWSLRVT